MINKLLILGGGNAGLISALMIKESFPLLEVALVKSSKIATIGVGEGSNEHWLEFARYAKISTTDIIQNAGATFKHGIKFTNWLHEGSEYYHSLPEFLAVQDDRTGLPYTMMRLVAENIPPENMVWKLAREGKIPEPLEADFGQFHFDSLKLNAFLEKTCIERKIEVIEDTILNVSLSPTGSINTLFGEKGYYSADLFIDTSGFERILSKRLGTQWQSYEKYLPVNSAIAFPSPLEGVIPTFTEARARKNGWSWKSPVQGRYGNGYVYCDHFTNLDAVLDEIQKDYSEEIKIAKEVKFTAGKVDKFWVKNCIAMGLAGSFIEPLEASNIGTTIQQTRCLISALTSWTPDDNFVVDRYNKTFDEVSENILDFVQLHYLSGRSDTAFWKYCTNDVVLTDFNQRTLKHFKKNFVGYNYFHNNIYELFDELDWIQVMHGLQMFDVPSIQKKYYESFRHLDSLSKYQISTVITEDHIKFYQHDIAISKLKEYK